MAATATTIYFYEACSNDAAKKPQWQTISLQSPVVDPIDSLRVLTWNIWFDNLEQRTRFSAILSQILSIPHLDVVGLQEVTPEFLHLAKAHPVIQSDWMLTDYEDEQHKGEVEPTWYGNVFLVRRKWAGSIRGWVKRFPTSTMKRFVVMLEIFQGDTKIRVANAHFDSKEVNEDRERQFNLCHSLLMDNLDGAGKLSSSTLIILSGDLNLHQSSELEYITSHSSFQDSILITSLDPDVRSPESSTMGRTFPKQNKRPRRSDFIFFLPSPWNCTQYTHMGNSPILSHDEKDPLPCSQGRGGELFPSDHLAVFTQFSLT